MQNIDKLTKAINELNMDRISLIADRGGYPANLDEDGYYLSECIDELVETTNKIIMDIKNERN